MDELLKLMPPIRRMRGNRLYAVDGRRFLDLWLDDGRGILGDRDHFTRTLAANAADKGLTRPYPGLYDARFRKALTSTWPGFDVIKLYQSEERTLKAADRILAAISSQGSASQPFDAAMLAGNTGSCDAGAGTNSLGNRDVAAHNPGLLLARPFIKIPPNFDLALPRLPCPRPFSPWCLMARGGTAAAAALQAESDDILTAQSLLAAARGLASLESAMRDGYGEDVWVKFDRRLGSWFRRSGPYLFPVPGTGAESDKEKYTAFFRAALEGGTLISPRMDAPSVIPPDFDDGELVKLARSLEKIKLR